MYLNAIIAQRASPTYNDYNDMEFLDPKKQRAHTIRLLIGYVFIAIALMLATTILIYQARGFGYKDGQVIQNGFVFMSSAPGGADIFINGKKAKEVTNSRLTIPAGQYTFELKREGYRDWRRAINVEGGVVQRFDYPFLVPAKLTANTVKKYDTQPSFMTQSLDRRWLMIGQGNAFGAFDLYDLNAGQATPELLKVPDDILAAASGVHSWKLVEWASDNRHVLLQHVYGPEGQHSEYIMVDREEPAKTVNLTTLTGLTPTTMSLRDRAYDQYYMYDANAGNVFTAAIKKPTPELFLQHVLAYKSHDDNRMLYATTEGAPAGKVLIRLKEGDRTHTLKTVPAGTKYLLDMARYDDDWYIVAGAQSESRTYVYRNPVTVLNDDAKGPLVPVQILKTPTPNRIAFSANTRFIMAQNGSAFSVYDAENDRGYKYDLKLPVDSSSGYAEWMDGHRLTYVTGGKQVIFEFDDANQETLVSTLPTFLPKFDRDYDYVYALSQTKAKAADGKEITQYSLSRTALRTAEDL